jgi:hypothetical protein
VACHCFFACQIYADPEPPPANLCDFYSSPINARQNPRSNASATIVFVCSEFQPFRKYFARLD